MTGEFAPWNKGRGRSGRHIVSDAKNEVMVCLALANVAATFAAAYSKGVEEKNWVAFSHA